MHTIKIGLKETSNVKQKKTFKCEKEDGRPGKGREGKGRERPLQTGSYKNDNHSHRLSPDEID